MRKTRSSLALVLTSSLIALGLVATVPVSASGASTAPDCAALNDRVYQVAKPKNDATLATVWAKEAAGAANYGFTDDLGPTFDASATSATGLVSVHRLYRASGGQDYLYSTDPDEWSAKAQDGYEDQGRSFYASPVTADCTIAVYRYVRNDRHRLAAAKADRDLLAADGWTSEGVIFYGAPPSGLDAPAPEPAPEPDPAPVPAPDPDTSDTVFSFAAMPDTQQEVLSSSDPRFLNRTNWLVSQKSALDLRFVTHSGDVHNWDTPDHAQYEISSKAMAVLEKADIPYTLAIGNHDTMATTVGGGARDPKLTRILQRDTDTFNSYYDASRFGVVSGAFEPGKVDNVYALYEAGGVSWMVLTLELWPRQAAVDWAKKVVASHPDANVVVVTHDYINGSGEIEQSANYGELSPQDLYDQLISRYANVRMVLSGHTGYAGSRVDTGVQGNKIYSFLTTIHSNTTNPVRMFTIDTKAGTIKTWIYCPYTKATYSAYSKTITGVNWVR